MKIDWDIRPTDKIDDPTWKDIQDRDALIRKLSHIINSDLDKMCQHAHILRSDLGIIADRLEIAMNAIDGDKS